MGVPPPRGCPGPQETRKNTRHASFHAGRHREPPELRQISATSNGRSPARVRHVEGGPFCKNPTKNYWNRAILTALKARSNFQVRNELGFNISAGLKSRFNLVLKFKLPFVNSCQIQILQKHWDQITDGFFPKGPPSTFRTLAGERPLKVAEI